MIRFIVVGNLDSFTYNLVEYFSEQTVEGKPLDIEICKNIASLDKIRDLDPDAIVISPRPGYPKNDRDASVTNDVLTELSTEIPALGICLNLEAAAYAYGSTIDHAPGPVHGKAFPVDHDSVGVFASLEDSSPAGRYHLFTATDVSDCFDVSATTDHDSEALVMDIRRRDYPIECAQFRPESVLMGSRHDVVKNSLTTVAGFDVARVESGRVRRDG